MEPQHARDLPPKAFTEAGERIAGRVARTPMLASRSAARLIEGDTGVGSVPVHPATGRSASS